MPWAAAASCMRAKLEKRRPKRISREPLVTRPRQCSKVEAKAKAALCVVSSESHRSSCCAPYSL
eukprot:2012068-Amphidinium_carterae.1